MSSSTGLLSTSSLLSRARGRGLTSIAKQGLGTWILSIVAAGTAGLNSILQLLLVPVDLLISLFDASISAFFLAPFGIVEEGARTTAKAVSEFGIFGLMIAVVIVLATIWIIIQYLNQQDTTDVPIPGAAVDLIPFIGVNEEADDEGG